MSAGALASNPQQKNVVAAAEVLDSESSSTPHRECLDLCCVAAHSAAWISFEILSRRWPFFWGLPASSQATELGPRYTIRP